MDKNFLKSSQTMLIIQNQAKVSACATVAFFWVSEAVVIIIICMFFHRNNCKPLFASPCIFQIKSHLGKILCVCCFQVQVLTWNAKLVQFLGHSYDLQTQHSRIFETRAVPSNPNWMAAISITFPINSWNFKWFHKLNAML